MSSEGMMMLAYSANQCIPISDAERALDFYINTLGFEKRADTAKADGARLIEVAPPGARRAVTLARVERARRSGDDRFVGVILGTNDIQSTYRQLRARGVHFTAPPTPQPAGMLQAEFLDRDGNGIVLIQP